MGLELRTDFLPEHARRGPELFLLAKNCTCVLGRGHPASGPLCPSRVPSSQACLDWGCRSSGVSLVAQTLKDLPAMQETWV